MRVLVIGNTWMGVAQIIQGEGHTTFFHTYFPSLKGQGLVQKTSFHSPIIKRDNTLHLPNLKLLLSKYNPELVVIEDGWKSGLLGDFFRPFVPTFGGGVITDAIKENVSYEKKLWEKLNLKEAEVGGIWNGEKFTHLFEWLEEDHFMGRNSGVPIKAGGCGRVITVCPTLEKFIPLFKKMSYRGYVGVHKKKISFSLPLSFFEIYLGNVTTFFSAIAKMERPKGKTIQDQVFIQNLLSLPPFPFGNRENLGLCEGLPLNFQEKSLKHLWLDDVKEGLKCSGESGRVGLLTARGGTVKEAARRLYRTITMNLSGLHQVKKASQNSSLYYQNMESYLQFRTDLGLRASRLFSPPQGGLQPYQSVPPLQHTTVKSQEVNPKSDTHASPSLTT